MVQGSVSRRRKARGRPFATGSQVLGPEQITARALQLLDQNGLEALNMRALARQLGVQASALYWHIGDKSELIGLMAWHFYAMAIETATGSRSAEEWLLRFGQSFHAGLCAHRDAARLCAIARPRDQDPVSRGDRIAAPLLQLGLSRKVALVRMASVISLALGWAVYEQSEAQREYLARMISLEEGFDTGLCALLRGFSADSGKDRKPPARRRPPNRGASALLRVDR